MLSMHGIFDVPFACMLCMMNIRQTGAKVEAIMSEFVQLKQEAGQGGPQVSFLGSTTV